MKATNKLKVTFIAAAFAALFTAEAQAASAPRTVRVRNLSYAGSGCPVGSVAMNISATRDSFTMLFDSFVAEIGPGVSLSQKRKNCQLLLDLDFSAGWSYAVKSLNYSGFLSLERGISAAQQTSIYFQGSSATGALKSTFMGPANQDFHIADQISDANLVWSPCGAQRALNINTQIMLTSSSSNAHGLMALQSDAGDLPGGVGNLKLVWKRCR